MLARLLLLLITALPASAQIWANDCGPIGTDYRVTYIFVGSDGQLQFDNSGRARVAFASHSDNHQVRFTVKLSDDADIHFQSGEGLVTQGNGSRSQAPGWGAGPDDSQVRFRYRFLNDETVKFGLLSTTTVPTGSITTEDQLGIGQGFMSQTEELVLRLDLDRWQIWHDAFFNFPLNNFQTASTTWGYSFCLGYTIGDLVQPTIEMNYTNTQPGHIKSLAITPGVSFMPGDFIIQVAVQRVIAGTNTDAVLRPILFFHYNF